MNEDVIWPNLRYSADKGAIRTVSTGWAGALPETTVSIRQERMGMI